MARATSGLAYPKRFYAGFDGGSSTSSVTSKFPNDVALLLYTLYQQWFPMSYSDRSWSYGWLATTMVAAATVGLVEVEACLKISAQLPVTYASCALSTSLLEGINWLNKALEVLPSCHSRQIKLSDAEKVLVLSQKLHISFPLMVGQIQNAIDKHNFWLEQVVLFFKLNCDDRSWISLLNLKEIGITYAFNCSELDMVLAEVQKVEQWKQNCKDIAGVSTGDEDLLTSALFEVKSSLDRSFVIYEKSKCCETEPSCISCSTGTNDDMLVTCSICKDCFHLQCVVSSREDANCGTTYVCHYCNFVNSGKISRNKCGLMRPRRKCPDLNKLIELLSHAGSLSLWAQGVCYFMELSQTMAGSLMAFCGCKQFCESRKRCKVANYFAGVEINGKDAKLIVDYF